MYNIYDRIKSNPDFYRQLSSGDSLLTRFQCLLDNKFQDAWSHFNYFVYVIEGRKIWHTLDGSYDLHKGNCAFVRKGACIVEQFFETDSCFIFFFMPDEFICDALANKPMPPKKVTEQVNSLIPIQENEIMHAFFNSMLPYFQTERDPSPALLELKFKELILTLADDQTNQDLLAYFYSILQQSKSIEISQVMEKNFRYNLKLEEFAKLSARSLSAFKRDFKSRYHTSPGKWLLERRLNYALHLRANLGKTVSEAAFESGFENASHFSRAFRQRFGKSPAYVK